MGDRVTPDSPASRPVVERPELDLEEVEAIYSRINTWLFVGSPPLASRIIKRDTIALIHEVRRLRGVPAEGLP
jgi:hypothetical protein